MTVCEETLVLKLTLLKVAGARSSIFAPGEGYLHFNVQANGNEWKSWRKEEMKGKVLYMYNTI